MFFNSQVHFGAQTLCFLKGYVRRTVIDFIYYLFDF
jgi:hypothetical protein